MGMRQILGGRASVPGRRHRPAVEGLEGRELMAAPVLDPIAAQTVPLGKSLILPVTASDADKDPLTYTVTSSNPKVTVSTHAGDPFVQMNVNNFGSMTFQLFTSEDPNTVGNFLSLANRGFYNGLTFHRVVPNFVIQGGDPNGDGTGGPGYTFSDEFNADQIFTGNGQLAMANSGKDTNGSQFFVTVGQQRALDFNHTIFGQLVRGSDVLTAINNTPTNSTTGKPTTNVVISSVALIPDYTDAVLTIKAAPDAGPATITVKVDDGHGGTDTRTFQVNVATDTVNDPPFLGPVPTTVKAAVNQPATVTLTSTDLENDPVNYSIVPLDTPAHVTITNTGGTFTLTPDANYVGPIHLQARVAQQGATSRGSTTSPYDTQNFTLQVLNQTITVQGQPVRSNAGELFANKTVATFTPAVPGTAANYTATINWGDGSQPTTGTITPNGQGGYTVTGGHRYDLKRSYPVTITVQDTVNNVSGNGTTSATVVAPAAVAGDFDGDGKADLVAYRPSAGLWSEFLSSGAKSVSFGQANQDIPLSADFDGDGKLDHAVYRPSTAQWLIANSGGGGGVIQFGQPGVDVPVTGDYDGDGKADLAVFRPTTDQWFILLSGGGSKVLQFGQPGVDQPVPADFDGDGKTDLAVYRPTNGQWLILQTTAGGKVTQFSASANNIPIPADYDGDGKADLAVYDPATARWYINGSTSGVRPVVQFGQAGVDVPVPADYDGDGKADLATFRPTTAQWSIANSAGGGGVIQFGAPSSDVPVTVPLASRYKGGLSSRGRNLG